VKELLRHREVRLYFAGQSLSGLGDASLWLAAAIWVKTLTGSAAAAGMAMFFFALSTLFGPVIGVVADRVRRLPLIIGANAAGMAVVLPLLFVTGPGAVWVVYGVMLSYGVLNRIIMTAESALLVTVVPDRLLANANGIIRSTQESMRIGVPLLGAGLFAWQGIRAVVLLDLVTFAGAIVFFALMRPNEPKPERAPADSHWATEMLAGARYVYRHAVLRSVISGWTIAALVFGFTESGLFAVVADGLHRTAAFVGVLGMVQGIGAVVSGLLVGRVATRVGEVRLTALGLLGVAGALLLLMIPSLPWVLGAMLLAGMALPLAVVGATTLLQRYTPNNLQGRVYSCADFFWSGASTASIAIGAGLLTFLSYQVLFLVATAFLVIGSAVVLTGRRGGPPVTPEDSTVDSGETMDSGEIGNAAEPLVAREGTLT
jgi:MFS family permease